jgi:RHS repeat-associated protein
VWSTLPIATFTDIGGKGGFFYVGQEYDATTGLQYSRARYYDPVSSEFISQDPLGFAGGDTNLYRRAGNSPANATDPSGMIVETGWDAFSLGVGLVSLGYNLRYGTWKDVGYDVLGIVADVGATLLPGVPGGAGVAIRATRLGARAADAVAASATLQRSIKAVQLANLGANTIQGVESGVNAYDAYQDGRYTEAVFNGIGAGFAGLHLGTSAAGSAGRAARALGGGFSAGFSESLGRQGARLYSAEGAAASGIEATANGLRRGVQGLAPVSEATLSLRMVDGMSSVEFAKKARALQELGDQGKLVRAANPVARDPGVTNAHRQDMIRRIWAQYGSQNREFANKLIDRVTRRMSPDHVHELQLGGVDADSNLKFLDRFTNWHVGTQQIRPQLRNVPVGTTIRIKVE